MSTSRIWSLPIFRLVSGFYQSMLGLKPIEKTASGEVLGVAGNPLLTLTTDRNARPAPRNAAGLFHTAFLMPNRTELARWLRHAANNGAFSRARRTIWSARRSTSPIPKATASRSMPTVNTSNGSSIRTEWSRWRHCGSTCNRSTKARPRTDGMEWPRARRSAIFTCRSAISRKRMPSIAMCSA